MDQFDAPRDIMKDGSNRVSYGLDEGLIVEFYPQQVHMEYLSKTIGHPIFQEQIFTRIVAPGNNKTVWVHQTKGIVYEMVQDPDSGEYHTSWEVLDQCENGDQPEPLKYPKAWNRFLKKGISADNGYPIEQWGAITRSYAESLKANNVHTVEGLASLSDLAAQNIMGAIKYRDLARAFLDESKRTQILAKEQERATLAEDRNAIMQKQIEALQAQVIALQSKSDAQVQPNLMDRPNTPQVASEVNQIKKLTREQVNKKHRIPDEAA